jgi:imidazoleglycerol phosphate synthase glutamine amidotransferase subunit HisH
VAPVLRLSVVLAASEVAEAVSLVLPRVGQFLEAADDVAAREILRSVTVVFPRHAEVLGGFTEVITAVAAMVAVMAVMAVMTMMVVMAVVVVVVEEIIQETSEERCGKKWQHAILHCR